MSSNPKKSVKDHEPKSVQEKLDEKGDELREKRTRKLDEKREKSDTAPTSNDPFANLKIEVPAATLQIRVRSQQPAPKITAGNSVPLADEDFKKLTTRMKAYCDALGEQYLTSQVELYQRMGQELDPKQFDMRTFRVEGKLYGRKKKFFTIVCDEKAHYDDKVWTQTHAFVDPLNGDVYKPNGRSPSKRPIHNLLNDTSFEWVLEHCTWTGSELYKSNASRDWIVQ